MSAQELAQMQLFVPSVPDPELAIDAPQAEPRWDKRRRIAGRHEAERRAADDLSDLDVEHARRLLAEATAYAGAAPACRCAHPLVDGAQEHDHDATRCMLCGRQVTT